MLAAVGEPFCTYFKKVASFLVYINEIYSLADEGRLRNLDEKALREINGRLYEDITGIITCEVSAIRAILANA